MKADISRDSHRPAKRFTGARQLQGRPAVDALFNEQLDIALHRARETRRDIIGAFGIPEGSPTSLQVTFEGGQLIVHGGVAYVRGRRFEWDGETHMIEGPQANPLLIEPSAAGFVPRTWRVDLHIREDLVTELMDPDLQEPALLGVEHGARQHLVGWLSFFEGEDNGSCVRPHRQLPPLQLRPVLQADDPGAGPCVIPSEASYRGLDNVNVRFEVWRVDGDTLTIKWDRDNGSVEMLSGGAVEQQGSQLLVPGPFDPAHALDRLEANDLLETGGFLVRYAGQDEDGRGILVGPVGTEPFPTPADLVGGSVHLRRWQGLVDVERGQVVPLFAGLSCVIEDAALPADAVPGDLVGAYWTLPARAAIGESGVGDVLWPERDADGEPVAMLAEGPEVIAVSLAVLRVQETGSVWIEDCRVFFPPLTELDPWGEASPGPSSDCCATYTVSPQEDWVGVLRGLRPGEDAHVCFQVGEYTTEERVELADLGHIVLSGCGPGAHIVGVGIDCALHVTDCQSIRIEDLAVSAQIDDGPTPGRPTGPGSFTAGPARPVPRPGLSASTTFTARRPSTAVGRVSATALRAGRTLAATPSAGRGDDERERRETEPFAVRPAATLQPVFIGSFVARPQLLGALTITRCGAVDLSGCRFETSGGDDERRACVLVGQSADLGMGPQNRGAVTVRHCQCLVGDRQFGIIVRDAASATIVHNEVVGAGPAWSGPRLAMGVARGSIVCTGASLGEVTIADNHISRSFEGITVTEADSLRVADNRLSLAVAMWADIGDRGILVGDARHVVVCGNEVRVVQPDDLGRPSYDAPSFRVALELEGTYGPSISLNGNVLVGPRTAIQVTVEGRALPELRLWRSVENLGLMTPTTGAGFVYRHEVTEGRLVALDWLEVNNLPA